MRRRFTHIGCLVVLALMGVIGVTSAPGVVPIVAADPSPGCVVDVTGILGWWRGEDAPNAVFGPDLAGATAYADGAVGRGFAFGPTGDVRADVFPAPTQAVTVEAWVKPNPPTGRNQVLLSRWDFPSTDDSARAYSLVLDPYGTLVWSTDETGTRRPEELRVDANAILDGGFHHVAATWDQTTSKLYLDGVAVASAPSQRGTLNAALTTPLRLGAKSGIGDPFSFSGIIDEPTVWSRALDATEIAAVHAAGIAGKCSFLPVEQAKFVTTANSANSRLGQSVGVSGTTVVAGAPFSNVATQFAGAAYVYGTADGISWTQRATLIASDPALVDFFGWAVDIDGDTIVVGSYGNNGGGTDSGAAYVFVRSGAVWTQQAKLVASDAAPSDGFGYSVGISGDTIVVGSPNVDLPVGGDAGAAYVFVRSGSTWVEQAKLVADDGTSLDGFGAAVAISGESIVIGSPGDDEGPDLNRGAAYVYRRSAALWTQQARLDAPAPAADDRFGTSVAIDGDRAAVGAPLDDGTVADSGTAHVFTRVGTDWTHEAQLAADDSEPADRFGFAVGIDGFRVVVGADREGDAGDQRGAAYVFDRASSVWTLTTKLLASDAAGGDQFGYSVDISGRMVVGAHLDDDRGNNAGAAYAFGP